MSWGGGVQSRRRRPYASSGHHRGSLIDTTQVREDGGRQYVTAQLRQGILNEAQSCRPGRDDRSRRMCGPGDPQRKSPAHAVELPNSLQISHVLAATRRGTGTPSGEGRAECPDPPRPHHRPGGDLWSTARVGGAGARFTSSKRGAGPGSTDDVSMSHTVIRTALRGARGHHHPLPLARLGPTEKAHAHDRLPRHRRGHQQYEVIPGTREEREVDPEKVLSAGYGQKD